MNKVMLLGRLTKDVELRHTNTTGKAVTQFTLAVNKAGNKDADFINVVAWDKTAEFASKYLGKGRQVVVVGRLSTRTYEKDGNKVYVTEVVAESVYFADSKKSETGSADHSDAPDGVESAGFPVTDELPF